MEPSKLLSEELTPLYSSQQGNYSYSFFTGGAPFAYIPDDNIRIKWESKDITFLFKSTYPSYFNSENRISSFNGIKLFDYSFKLRSFFLSKNPSFLDNKYFFNRNFFFIVLLFI